MNYKNKLRQTKKNMHLNKNGINKEMIKFKKY